MAHIEWHPALAQNIIVLPSRQAKKIRRHYEKGDVVIIGDLKVDADYGFLSKFTPPSISTVRKDKYVFTKKKNGKNENRNSKWSTFSSDFFIDDFKEFQKFQCEVQRVERQIEKIIYSIFRREHFSTEFISWKFQRVDGENMHIDNLACSNHSAQVRLFANLDTAPRLWSVGAHMREYAERLFDTAALGELADDPYLFNGRLSQAAFGASHQSCNEPRHLVEFEPGEIWLTNSALVAHQVRWGRLLCTGHFEYPYGRCLNPKETLPAQIQARVRKSAGHPAKSCPANIRNRLQRLVSRNWW